MVVYNEDKELVMKYPVWGAQAGYTTVNTLGPAPTETAYQSY